jgi:hypothetical protein
MMSESIETTEHTELTDTTQLTDAGQLTNAQGVSGAGRGIRTENGVVMVTIVLIFTTLLMICALAVDAAIYYFRGIQIQRVADSASLSGVTQMPRLVEADRAARLIAKGNGFVDGEDGIVIKTDAPIDNNKRFTITISDDRVPLFFGRLMKESWGISKKSTAEFLGNIPLGSTENALGTGYLTGPDPLTGMSAGYSASGFWLGVSGPCAAKEQGDAASSRYDGNTVNVTTTENNPYLVSSNINRAGAYLCDTTTDLSNKPAAQRKTDLEASIAAKRTATGTPDLFPALVANKDYDLQGYNYIVDVPCAPDGAGAVKAPPCGADPLPGKLVIQMYDPMFNPDSVQSFLHGFESRPQAKPDRFGLAVGPVTGEAEKCYVGSPDGCAGRNFGADNPKPESVNVITDVRVFASDNTPEKYDDDILVTPFDPGTPRTIVANSDPYLLNQQDPDSITAAPARSEHGKVRRFGRCMRLTDGWTSTRVVGGVRQFVGSPQGPTGYVAPGVPAADAEGAWANEATTWVGGTAPAECATSADKWVTLAELPSGTRGQYRVNVRTVDSVNSFGTNAFALRAYFLPNAANGFQVCNSLGTSVEDRYCPSISGDSTMSVYASVPQVTSFYLAKLAPPTNYRNKIVIVNLWDPGEGADKLEILKPILPSAAADPNCPADPSSPGYCLQKFEWSLVEPGITQYSSADPLDPNGPNALDPCASMQPQPSPLSVSGGENLSITGCDAFPTQLQVSRNYRGATDTFGKFNDRMVAIAVQIPTEYGCAIVAGLQTGILDRPCIELTQAELEAQLKGGWWRIKYTPERNPDNSFKAITDRTTWRVSLRGDGVRIINR